MKKKYMVLEEKSRYELSDRVEFWMKQDWECVGSVSARTEPAGWGFTRTYYMQAMEKE